MYVAKCDTPIRVVGRGDYDKKVVSYGGYSHPHFFNILHFCAIMSLTRGVIVIGKRLAKKYFDKVKVIPLKQYRTPLRLLIDLDMEKCEYDELIMRYKNGLCVGPENTLGKAMLKAVTVILSNLEQEMITSLRPSGIMEVLKAWDPNTYGGEKLKEDLKKRSESFKRVQELKNESFIDFDNVKSV